MKQQFGKSPKKILREMRFSIIIKCLNEDLEMTGYCVALEAGLKDEKALYKFLSTHFDTSLTTIRKEILQDLLEY
jgi:methylphosphotriester-DNA--protein-cysteine methyltransferase